MTTNDDHKDNQLILFSRILTGETTEKEKTEFKKLIQSDENAKSEFNKLKKIWDGADISDLMPPEEIEADWNSIKTHWTQQESGRKWGLLKVAASLALLMVVTITFYLMLLGRDMHVQTTDGIKTTKLPDGTIVTLNHSSKLTYSRDFNTKTRNVIFEGEGYFEVAENPNKPFVIQMKETEISVLGTAFNISNHPDKNIILSVSDGRVKFSDASQNEIVMEGESLVYARQQKTLSKQKTIDKNATAWKNKSIRFVDDKLKYVASVLESVYSIDIDVEKQSQDCTLTVAFDNTDLEDVLAILEEALSMNITKKKETFVFSNAECL